MDGNDWILEPEKQLIWHNGSTVAFHSILAVSQKHGVAVVALTDTGIYKLDQNGNPPGEDLSLQQVVFECLR